MSTTQTTQFDKDCRLKLFLCHTAADKPVVRQLYRRLKADGFHPWLDEENLVPGQNWREEIPKAVRASDAVLVCLSQNSITKEGFVQKEIKFALDIAEEKPPGTIFIIPVRLEAVEVPDRLKQWQWANFFQQDGYERVVGALRLRAGALGLTIQPVRSQVSIVPPQNQPKGLPLRAKLSQVTAAMKALAHRLQEPFALVDLVQAACVGACWAAGIYFLDRAGRFIGSKVSFEVQVAAYGTACGMVLALFLRSRMPKLHWKHLTLIALGWSLGVCLYYEDPFFRATLFFLRRMALRPAREITLHLFNSMPFMVAGALTGLSALDARSRRVLHALVGAVPFGLSFALGRQFLRFSSNYDFILEIFFEGLVGTWLLFLFMRLLAAHGFKPQEV